jgi:hypothetical protein
MGLHATLFMEACNVQEYPENTALAKCVKKMDEKVFSIISFRIAKNSNVSVI